MRQSSPLPTAITGGVLAVVGYLLTTTDDETAAHLGWIAVGIGALIALVGAIAMGVVMGLRERD